MTLARGKFTLSRTKVVEGGPAYAIGILFILPLPLELLAGAVIGFFLAATGRLDVANELQEKRGLLIALELIISAGLLVPAFVIAAVKGKAPESNRWKEEPNWDDDDDYDVPASRRREREEDDFRPQPSRAEREDDLPRRGAVDRDFEEEKLDREDSGRRQHRRAREQGLSGGEFALFSLLFLVPGINVLVSSILYYVWRSEQPRRANQINTLGFAILGIELLLGCVIGMLIHAR